MLGEPLKLPSSSFSCTCCRVQHWGRQLQLQFLGCGCAFLSQAGLVWGCRAQGLCLTWLFPCCPQVLILLYIADWMVHWMWGRDLDPDNFSIPYLTALGDLIGTGLLALSFHVLWLIGDRDSDVGD